jgi:hypothetical protein
MTHVFVVSKAMVIGKGGKMTIVEQARSVAGSFIDCFCRPVDHSGDFDV